MTHSNVLTALDAAALLPDNRDWTNRMTIRSESSSREYTVAQRKSNGEWACSCPGWIYKRAGRPRNCRHLSSRAAALREYAGGFVAMAA